jgi:hypothetical protein
MNYFLISWTNEGLECVVDVTEDHPDNFNVNLAMAMMSGEKHPDNLASHIGYQIKMRAQFNPQRQTEAYVIGTDLDLETVQEFAQTDIQALVNFTREKHFYKVIDTRNLVKESVIV